MSIVELDGMGKWQILGAGSIAAFIILSFLAPGAFAVDDWCNLSTCDATWDHRKKITIDNTKVSGSTNLSDFPVLISLSNDTDLKNNSEFWIDPFPCK